MTMNYGWIILENGKQVMTSNDSIEVFKTKRDLLDTYDSVLGELDTIQRVRIAKWSKQ